ncbi:ATP-dependent DNA helicase PIF1-like protein, partial [Tanacetum coccineum]
METLAAGIRRRCDIVLNVASNSIASLLMLGGRTAYSRFHIPINDEAPMENKLCFEALDRSLKDILRKNREVLQVMPKGARPEDVTEIQEFAEWILKVGDDELGEANDGLCNVTRLQVLESARTFISAQLINETNFGKKVIITR